MRIYFLNHHKREVSGIVIYVHPVIAINDKTNGYTYTITEVLAMAALF